MSTVCHDGALRPDAGRVGTLLMATKAPFRKAGLPVRTCVPDAAAAASPCAAQRTCGSTPARPTCAATASAWLSMYLRAYSTGRINRFPRDGAPESTWLSDFAGGMAQPSEQKSVELSPCLQTRTVCPCRCGARCRARPGPPCLPQSAAAPSAPPCWLQASCARLCLNVSATTVTSSRRYMTSLRSVTRCSGF